MQPSQLDRLLAQRPVPRTRLQVGPVDQHQGTPSMHNLSVQSKADALGVGSAPHAAADGRQSAAQRAVA